MVKTYSENIINLFSFFKKTFENILLRIEWV